MTQRQRVLQYLQQHQSISRLEAATEIGCFELASRIGELEAEGHKFERKNKSGRNRFGDSVWWTEYSLIKEATNEEQTGQGAVAD